MFSTVHAAKPVAARGFGASSGRANLRFAITVLIIITVTITRIARKFARIETVVFA